jgi:hypothetical protein
MKCGDRSTSDSKIWALGAETNLCDWKDKQTLKRTLGERVFFSLAVPACRTVDVTGGRETEWRIEATEPNGVFPRRLKRQCLSTVQRG